MKENVWIHVRGEQRYEGLECGCTELSAPGTMERTEDGYLLYYEERGGGACTRTCIALAPERMTVVRSGEVNAEMIFVRGHVHTSSYALPFGTVPAEVETEELRWRLGARGGLIEARYRIALGGQKGRCALRIRVRTREGDARQDVTDPSAAVPPMPRQGT